MAAVARFLSGLISEVTNVLPVGTSKYPTLASAVAAATAGDVIWLVDGDIYSHDADLHIPTGVHLMGSDPSQVTVASSAVLYLDGGNIVSGLNVNPSTMVVSGPGCDIRHNRIGNSSDLLSIPYTASGRTLVRHNEFYDMVYDGIRCNVGAQGIGVEVVIEDNEWDVDVTEAETDFGGFAIGMQAGPGPCFIIRRNNANIRSKANRVWLKCESHANAAGLVLSEQNRVRIHSTVGDIWGVSLEHVPTFFANYYPAITILDDVYQLTSGSGAVLGAYGETLAAGSSKVPNVTTVARSNLIDEYGSSGYGGAGQQVLTQISDQSAGDATPGATVSLDLDTARIWRWTAGEDETVNASNVPAAGSPLVLVITNDSTSARTISFGTGFNSTRPLAGTVGKAAVLRFISDGTKMVLAGVVDGLA